MTAPVTTDPTIDPSIGAGTAPSEPADQTVPVNQIAPADQPVVDRRAQRLHAEAAADGVRARNEAVRAQTAAEMQDRAAERAHRQAEQARRERCEVAAARDAARTRRRQERAGRRRERRAARAETARRVRAWATVTVPEAFETTVCLAPTAIGVVGQYRFAAEVMHLGPLAIGFPLMLEGAGWLLVRRRRIALAAGQPTGRLSAAIWVLALVAAGLNYWHGATDRPGDPATGRPAQHGDPQVGVAYGLASLVGFALAEVLARHARGATAIEQQRRARRRRALARALRFPATAWSAWSERVALGDDVDPELAWIQAWADREARRDQREARRAARRAERDARRAAAAGGKHRADHAGEADEREPSGDQPDVADELHDLPDVDGRQDDVDELGGAELGGDRQDRDGTDRVDVSDLLEAGRAAAARLAAKGARLTRDALVEDLRQRDVPLSTTRASALLAVLRAEQADHRPEPTEPEIPGAEASA